MKERGRVPVLIVAALAAAVGFPLWFQFGTPDRVMLRKLARRVRRFGLRESWRWLGKELRMRRAVGEWRREARIHPALPNWDGPATSRPPIFVGGTGRSGTTITGRLLAAHPAYALVPFEVHFITNRGGLCDLATGRTTMRAFERRFTDRWFVRRTGRGLHLFASRALVAQALRELCETFEHDGDLAIRRFVHRLFDPVAVDGGAEGWVEMTPNNGQVANTLLRIFPEGKLVHTVRDGRDVAASVARMDWGPSDPLLGMQWWGDRLKRAFEAAAGLPPDRVIVVQMEALFVRARDAELDRLLAWAAVPDHPDVRHFFDREVTAERSHGSRWRKDVPPEVLPGFLAAYEGIVADLRRMGWPYAPEPDDVKDATVSPAPLDPTAPPTAFLG